MAKGRNAKFGIVYHDGEVHVVRKMGVPEQNIVGVGRMSDVVSRMSAGDSLCVPSVKSFACGAYDLFCKLQYLAGNGIEFQSGNERYLSFSAIKPMPLPTRETLRDFAAREEEFIKWVQSGGWMRSPRQCCPTKSAGNLWQISCWCLRITGSRRGIDSRFLKAPTASILPWTGVLPLPG